MGPVKLEIQCPQTVNGIGLEPDPDWSFDTLLSELDSLEKKLNVASSVPMPFTKTKPREFYGGKGIKRSSNAFVMRVSDEEFEDSEGENEEVHDRGLVKAARFNCHEFYLSSSDDDSDDEPCLEVQTYLMNEVGLVESALFELTDERQLGVKVRIELLRQKSVLLLISDLEFPDQELLILEHMYNESRVQPTRVESQYEVIWIPVVDRSTPFDDTKRNQFESLQATMPWYSVGHPSIIEPAVIRYIKEVWGFSKKPLLVVLDPQGRVVNPNAIHMMFIWGNSAFPFTKIREEALWKEETWRIELLADSIDPSMINWLTDRKFICLYGGEDMDWIRKFTTTARAVAQTANIKLEMLYMGKRNPKEKVQRNMTAIQRENLSHVLPDVSLIWFFWVRLESMWHSRVQHGVTVENDQIMQEIMTMLSFDGSDQGWAVIGRGSDEMARAKAETILKSLEEYTAWEAVAADKGFIPALNDHIQGLRTEHHCNRLILPETTAGIGSIHDRVVCFECGKPMEKLFMYRCCTD